MLIDRNRVERIMDIAWADGRTSLLEDEGYDLLRAIGAGTPPTSMLFTSDEDITDANLAKFTTDQVVLKIQSPIIAHKTEAGGVTFVPKTVRYVHEGIHGILDMAPNNYAMWLSYSGAKRPSFLEGMSVDLMTYPIRKSIRGVLVVDFVTPDTRRFGAELLVGLRWTREFGPVLTAGLGGIDAEMFAEKFQEKAAVVTASPLMLNAEGFLKLFSETIAYKSISGQIRGRERIIDDEKLLKCFDAFIRLARTFSGECGDRCIHEIEVNPYVISDGELVPLDLLCSFGKAIQTPVKRPVRKIKNLLTPRSVGVVGVSSKSMNIGRIILRNLIKANFDCNKLAIVKPDETEIDGVKCYPTIADIPCKLDLLVLAVSAAQVPDLCKEIIETRKAESVILIPGGMGEKEGSQGRAREIEKMIQDSHLTEDGGPVFVGGNCLGVLSAPGNYNTLFVPERKLPEPEESTPVAFVSQSGAFMITRMSNQPIKPVYAISYGNQTDLTVSDYVHYLKDDPQVRVIAVYTEGFKDLDGLKFAIEVRDAIAKGKDVIFYKAGRTPAGASATAGHTASIAGEYKVCKAVLEQAGALVATSFRAFEALTELALTLNTKPILGNKVFATSNAGYESVGMADSIVGPGYKLEMARFEPATVKRITQILADGGLSELVDVKNPMDLNPMASDEVHFKIIEALMQDSNADAIVFSAVPLTHAMQTLPPGVSKHDSIADEGSVPSRLKALGILPKALVAVVDSGKIFDPLVDAMRELGIPTFRSADRAMMVLGHYIAYRLNKLGKENDKTDGK